MTSFKGKLYQDGVSGDKPGFLDEAMLSPDEFAAKERGFLDHLKNKDLVKQLSEGVVTQNETTAINSYSTEDEPDISVADEREYHCGSGGVDHDSSTCPECCHLSKKLEIAETIKKAEEEKNDLNTFIFKGFLSLIGGAIVVEMVDRLKTPSVDPSLVEAVSRALSEKAKKKCVEAPRKPDPEYDI